MELEEQICSTRRAILKGGMFAIALVCFRPNFARAQVLSAIETAVEIGKLAMGAAELFRGSSVSNSDEIIIRMLSNISQQLTVIQNSLATMASRIDEVKQLVGDLPAEVVQELSRANLRGCFRGYGEMLDTRSRYGTDHKSFVAEREPEVRRLIDDIRSSRNVLFNYHSQLNIPILAAALNIEYGCMRLIGENNQRVIPVAAAYRQYLVRALFDEKSGLQGTIWHLRELRKAALVLVGQPKLVVVRKRHYDYGYWESNVGYSVFKETPISNSGEFVRNLLNLGLIDSNEVHVNVSESHKLVYPGNHIASVCDEFQGVGHSITGCSPVTRFPTQEQFDKETEASRLNTEMNINKLTDQIYVCVSNYYAGSRALNFAEQIEQIGS